MEKVKEVVTQAVTGSQTPHLTTSQGAPVPDHLHTLTAGQNGPTLIQDPYLFEKHQSFNREKIPERIVHAVGAGAFGYFETTSDDIHNYCKASVFSKKGKKTQAFVRFSSVTVESGFPDSNRDPRGMAIKLYTDEGNLDFVCNNTPVFFIRDPMQFPDVMRAQKRNPKTHLKDFDAFWDFMSLTSESIHMIMMLFSDRGTPYGYRHLHGFGNHTFVWVNKDHKRFYVKYHFISDQGIKNFTWPESIRMCGEDPDFAKRDLWNSIESGNYPSWTFYVQIMPYEDAEKYKWDILDVTKVWPHSDYPLKPVGKLVLNQNPTNYFAQVEQSAFSPGHLVPGIEPSNDPVLQTRLIFYRDAQLHRIGPNADLIPVNMPKGVERRTFDRDGHMRVDENQATYNDPWYYPNSLKPEIGHKGPTVDQHPFKVEGIATRKTQFFNKGDDYEQPRILWEKVMKPQERENFITNVHAYLSKCTRREVIIRQCKVFSKVNRELGLRIATSCGIKPEELQAEEPMTDKKIHAFETQIKNEHAQILEATH